ncbi:hypothetical protein JZ751_013291 [Albula glossodonta]|uniref:Uncharacterized protein n=1 Tax=Albula glossodonta TaxID=121402 RepID=A0A8T2NUS9_9TELE|nr:hypothetical protein JZ751_013291 [Albula glossodonta]
MQGGGGMGGAYEERSLEGLFRGGACGEGQDLLTALSLRKCAKALLASAILCRSCFLLMTFPSWAKASRSSWDSFSYMCVRRCLLSRHSVISHFMARKRLRLSLMAMGTCIDGSCLCQC